MERVEQAEAGRAGWMIVECKAEYAKGGFYPPLFIAAVGVGHRVVYVLLHVITLALNVVPGGWIHGLPGKRQNFGSRWFWCVDQQPD